MQITPQETRSVSKALAVNCSGDVVIGYSGSGTTHYIGAYYSWLFAGSVIAVGPFTIQAGTISYIYTDRWGDYSYTSIDPSDDWSFWTVQQYADRSQDFNPWSTWINEVNRNP
ncbi:MAG TPA: hypothetical protein VL361_11775 [Candidatus Limnocylindrales bacterium]|jgi:hypothetical protein|nr:hypothetical protein [Candidatus Limnocylindrales bacterium]